MCDELWRVNEYYIEEWIDDSLILSLRIDGQKYYGQYSDIADKVLTILNS